MKNSDIAKSSEKALTKQLIDFAEAVDQELGTPSARPTPPKKNVQIRSYARAVEKGSNERARRTDRHEALVHVAQPFFKERKILARTA